MPKTAARRDATESITARKSSIQTERRRADDRVRHAGAALVEQDQPW